MKLKRANEASHQQVSELLRMLHWGPVHVGLWLGKLLVSVHWQQEAPLGKPSEGYDADAEEEDATDSELMPPRRMSVSDQLEILRRSSNAASRGGATATSSPLGGSSSQATTEADAISLLFQIPGAKLVGGAAMSHVVAAHPLSQTQLQTTRPCCRSQLRIWSSSLLVRSLLLTFYL
eukprot:CAMPEP_0178443042 /NCGR_PEP_ID=MMETSP0689_2-20121128/38588_1 /TAXON_ID=160604 /ORGANISM="Amphidinium massartii, Strain CS-259" /LENGTH=176 /DNA_ID=CAMNT_0020066831 /DNA_START=92 /DNA_END=622 /DNA_ORIENTATION=-